MPQMTVNRPFGEFELSTLFFKPVLIGILPSIAIWACVISAALRVN
jgi:hypothetical protein